MKRDTSASPFAILGMLSLCPMSGYDIKKMVESSISHFWNESYGQIYPLLKKLERQGLAERRSERQSGKPERLVYSITPGGREALEAWLQREPGTQPVRQELLLKLFFAAPGDAAAMAAHVERLQQQHTAALEQYRAITAGLARRFEGHPQLPYWLLTLEFGRHRSQGIVDWCRETLQALAKITNRPFKKGKESKR
jgi:DNA-binding PadR family transcriptional regulator